jgi:hypothetical protein
MRPIGVIGTTALFLVLGFAAPANARQEKQEEKDKPAKQEQQAKPEKQQQAKGQQEQRHRQQQQQAKSQQDQQRQHRRQQDDSAKQQQQQDKSARQEQQQQAKGRQDQERQQPQRRDKSAKQEQQQQAKGQEDQQRQQQHQRQNDRSAQQRSPEQIHTQQVAWQGDRARSWQSEHRTWQQRGGYDGYRVPDDRFHSYYGQYHEFRIYTLPVIYVGGHRRFQYGGYWFGLIDPWPEYWSNDWYDSDDVYVDYYGDGYYLYNRRYPGDRIAISFYLN